MNKFCDARDDYRRFLRTIDLKYYRDLFKDRKYVEQDLPKDVVDEILSSIYEYCWFKREFRSFDTWFEILWDKVRNLRSFNDFIWKYWHMRLGREIEWDEWFKMGFKARMYRTWTAILTQLDFCYTMACVVERSQLNLKLQSSAHLNKEGVDLRVVVSDKIIDFQVHKVSERKEARPGRLRKPIIFIPYPVISRRELDERSRSSTKRRGSYVVMLRTFDKYYEELENGFIVFKEELAKEIVRRISSGEDIGNFVNELTRCLRGVESCNL